MNTQTAVTILIIAVLLAGLFVWQFGMPERQADNLPDGAETAELREPDAEFPAAGVCNFPQGSIATFELNDGIPTPRCVRVLAGHSLAFANNVNRAISFEFAGRPFVIEPDVTVSTNRRVEDYLAPGVHVVSMDLYSGSGPEVWVQDARTFEMSGTVEQQFVSARAFTLQTPSGTVSLAITNETQIYTAQGAPVSPDNFSLVLTPGTFVTAIAHLPEADTGTALQVRVGGTTGGGIACTMEAKICPDGTAVGRTGPNCEFTPCPGE